MVRYLFELGVNLIESFIIVDFLARFFGSKVAGTRGVIGFIAMLLLLFGELSFMNSMTPFEGVSVMAYVISLTVYAIIFLKGNSVRKVILCTLIVAIDMILAISVNLIVSMAFQVHVFDTITTLGPSRIILIVITKLLLFYITRLILKFKTDSVLSLRDGIMLIAMPVINIISMSFMMRAVIKNDNIKGEMLIAMSSVLLVNAMVYYLFMKISKDNKAKMQYELLIQNYEAERKNTENMKALSSGIQELKHDLKNHLILLQSLLQGEKYAEAEEYIRTLAFHNIESAVQIVSTGNNAFDAIMNAKLSICKKKGIFIELNTLKENLDFMKDEDICVLFGNLLDNAIEASEKTEEKYIQLKMQIQGFYLSIFIANSIEQSVIKDNMALRTTKRDKERHGFGMKSIHKVIDSYGGMISFFEENNEFCCDILLEIV